MFRESVEAQAQHLEELRSKGNPIQPFIVMLELCLSKRKFCYILIRLCTILRAIEVCYKIFHLINLEYPLQSFTIWLFIQKNFFGVHSKYDKPFPKLVQILAELNQ